ncbi:hypothetical protein EOT10_16380 [Streptomyces antnestii]|uniref:Uncharacterized protein n=1 Tax=Streptomyces antnestii TaxID=2494256 RepID=A0A437PN00_9ACTN|nr:hypothetical protein [Streptomyces sp. San01]RVU23661.1 hypothetical protein EOT10_16380 [Streptomyces sp. San01]
MAKGAPVSVYPPSPDGGRRVTIRGADVGTAYNLLDVLEFLHTAGLPKTDTTIDDPELIDWHSAGPDYWGPDGPENGPGDGPADGSDSAP